MMNRTRALHEVFYNLMNDENWLKHAIKNYNGEDLESANWWELVGYIDAVGDKLWEFLWKWADRDANFLLDYHYFHNENGWDLAREIED